MSYNSPYSAMSVEARVQQGDVRETMQSGTFWHGISYGLTLFAFVDGKHERKMVEARRTARKKGIQNVSYVILTAYVDWLRREGHDRSFDDFFPNCDLEAILAKA